MKHLYLTMIFFITVFFVKAQSDETELGLRLGNSIIAADLTVPVKYHRIRTNLGWGYEYYMFDNYFHLLFPVYREERFVYAGLGLGLRYWDVNKSSYDGFGFAVIADLGGEIRLKRSDFTVGLDANPAYDLIMEKFIMNVSLSARYRF
jgi:hypothetical protein